MRYLGEIEWFLDIRIAKNRHQHVLHLCQDSYIDKLKMKFNIDLAKKPPGSPLMKDYFKNASTVTKQEVFAYQQRVEFINYAAVITRLDVAQAAFKLSEFLINPLAKHLYAANRVLLYLAHIKNLSIRFDARVLNQQSIFLASSDASFADDFLIRHSSQKYGFKLFDDIVDWKAFKQKTVTTSSTETKLLAISTTRKELIWWTKFFNEIFFQLLHISIIQCDNIQRIKVLSNPTSAYIIRLKHIDVHRHWLIQKVRKQKINIRWTPTAKILADGFTKPLPPQKHEEFLRLIGLCEMIKVWDFYPAKVHY